VPGAGVPDSVERGLAKRWEVPNCHCGVDSLPLSAWLAIDPCVS
jgi:hypothetical protein